MTSSTKQKSNAANQNTDKDETNAKAKAAIAQIFWDVVTLSMRSASHKHLFLSDLEWLVLPPMRLGQFRLWQEKGAPIAFVSWALINEEVEQRLSNGEKRLKPSDWNSGDKLVIIDVVAPFGGHEKIKKELQEKIFKDQTFHSLKAKGGSGFEIVEE